MAIRSERPELETRSAELMSKAEQMKIKLNAIEQELLQVIILCDNYRIFFFSYFVESLSYFHNTICIVKNFINCI